MTIRFYTNPMSRGQIARWALHEAGADYEQVLLEYGGSMKSDDYLAINPMGKVPAIEHDGRVVTEAAAICAYLAEAFPDSGLAPREDERADYYRWLFFAAGPVEQAVTARSVLKVEPDEEQQPMVGYGSYDRTVDALEQALAGRDYICGSRFTAADVYVGSTLDWGIQFESLPARPAFETYVKKLRQRPAYRESKQIDQGLIEQQQSDS